MKVGIYPIINVIQLNVKIFFILLHFSILSALTMRNSTNVTFISKQYNNEIDLPQVLL